MGDLLDALIRALLSHPMPGWIDMPRRAGQTIGPPDGGTVEHDVAFGPVVDRGGVMARILAIDQRFSCSHDLHAGKVHHRGAVPLPANQAFDRIPLLHSRPLKQPVLRHGARPVAAASAGGSPPGPH